MTKKEFNPCLRGQNNLLNEHDSKLNAINVEKMVIRCGNRGM